MIGKLYPIGTIVKIQNQQRMIVGYSLVKDEDGNVKSGYSTVPHPVGYVNFEKLLTFASDQVEIISCGFENIYSKVITDYMELMNNGLKNVSAEEFTKCMKQMESENYDE